MLYKSQKDDSHHPYSLSLDIQNKARHSYRKQLSLRVRLTPGIPPALATASGAVNKVNAALRWLDFKTKTVLILFKKRKSLQYPQYFTFLKEEGPLWELTQLWIADDIRFHIHASASSVISCTLSPISGSTEVAPLVCPQPGNNRILFLIVLSCKKDEKPQ